MKKHFFKKGFTIIELLVAMGVFVILIGIITNIFIQSLRTQRSIVALMQANDNASLALEQMAREIRTGKLFTVSGNALQFTNAADTVVTYQFGDSSSAVQPYSILRRESTGVFLPITGANVKITRLGFILTQPSLWPARITVTLQVGFTDKNLTNVLNDIQTTISARDI